ncbi:MAG: dTDP-4-dehydrorhamnose reductase [Ferruginibacter sp.]
MSSQTILITGAYGQLGSEIKKISGNYPVYDFLFTDMDTLAIEDMTALEKYFSANKISYCINCAAYTAVDKAEAAPDTAFLINGTAAGNLATICKRYNAAFIHVSTDYVFNGMGTAPYKEEQSTDPVNVYGASKLKGEELVQQNNEDAITIRTSWVYSSYGNNFVKTMLRLMKEKESISVVSDQFGRPTYAADLAEAIMNILIEKAATGKKYSSLYHFSDSGEKISWYDFAVAIKELSGSNCIVNPVPTSSYPTPAKRPQYSVLDLSKIEKEFDLSIPEWKSSLEKCLTLLA